MRLRLGRGLPRHNLQAVMDFEDFVYNRTDGSPQSVFKTLGNSGFYPPKGLCKVDTEGGPIVFNYVLFCVRKGILDFQFTDGIFPF